MKEGKMLTQTEVDYIAEVIEGLFKYIQGRERGAIILVATQDEPGGIVQVRTACGGKPSEGKK